MLLEKLATIAAKNEKGEVFSIVKTYSDYAENPREYSEHSSRFYTFERSYFSPDSHNYSSVGEWADDLGVELGNEPDDLIKSMKDKGYIALPVWRFEHSGVSYSASLNNPYFCPWDSGMVGIIYMSYTDIRKEYGVSRVDVKTIEKVRKNLALQVKEYSYYANGEVYLYELYDNNGESIEISGPFYGNLSDEEVCGAFGLYLA
jgi:hypothetical protein